MIAIGYVALYRKYRPQVFSEVVGQDHVTKTLKNQVANQKTAHAYLFNGPRGTGKTSIAKILSRAVNCLSPINGDPCNECEICKGILDGSIMDVIEIDAASNNSVDNVRTIRDEIVYTPSKAKYKVYIIDEVHMLSTGAFNALLKTLEEPPSHVLFILATTEPNKLPATIISRCQRFDFKKISTPEIFNRLKLVVEDTNSNIEDRALELIAHLSEGGMRDALSILDQSLALQKDVVTHEDILNMVGIVDGDILFDMSDAIHNKDVVKGIKLINKVSDEGKDITYFIVRLMQHYRNLMMAKVLKDISVIVDLSEENIERLKGTVENYSQSEITNTISVFSDTLNEAKKSNYPKVLLETTVVKLCRENTESDVSSIIDRLNNLENMVKQGIKVVPQNAKNETREENKGVNTINVAESPIMKVSVKVPAGADAIAKEISDNWNNILGDMRSKGFTPLKIQYLNGVMIKPFSENTVLGCVEFQDEIGSKFLEEKKLVMELKDSMLKVVGKEVDIRFNSHRKIETQEAPKESGLDKFKALVLERGMGGLLNEN